MLDPKIVEKLLKSRAVKVFIVFIEKEMNKLNTIVDIEAETPELVAIEIKARKLAHNKLTDILDPLLNTQTRSENFNSKEYVA